jgi:hypothetical protein
MTSVVKLAHPILGTVTALMAEGEFWIGLIAISQPRFNFNTKSKVRVYVDENSKVWVSLDDVNANLDFGYLG